jgi:hypothetical protein
MKKKKIIIAASIAAMTLSSCGGAEEQKTPIESLTDLVEMSQQYQEEPEESMDEIEVPNEALTSDEWNAILDDYERYVNSYIAFIKKQKENPADMAIVAEYQELMSQGVEWSTKMSEASSGLEFAQLSRMQQIQLKLAAAAF